MMLEIETKFRLSDAAGVRARLLDLGATAGPEESHSDTYFQHPARDFRQTKEALRIRRIDSVASVTYKGQKLDVGDPTLKARRELEWSLAPGDSEGAKMTELLLALGFRAIATVSKQREPFAMPATFSPPFRVSVTLDRVVKLGDFAEIEWLAEAGTSEEVEAAREGTDRLAGQLRLTERTAESYLGMWLAGSAGE